MADLKQVGTLSCYNEIFQISVMKSGWLAHEFSAQPGCYDALQLHSFTLSRIILIPLWMLSVDAPSLSCSHKWWDPPAFAACDIQCISLVLLVLGLFPFSVDTSTLQPWCPFSVFLCVVCFFVTWPKGTYFGSGWSPHLSFHPGFVAAKRSYCLCDHHIINSFTDTWCHY